MKEKLKIVLGKKDLFPYKNEDVFVNLELSRDSDELVNEIINNNFNLNEQFIKEREKSLKFCVYGICETNFSDTENITIEASTNHLDRIYSPRFSTNISPKSFHTIKTIPLSHNSSLSKNIFLTKKSSYYFMFEINPLNINNVGENKDLILKIRDSENKIYASIKIPFMHYNSEGVKILYGTETVEIDLKGKQTVVENDFKFLYDTHWVRDDLNLFRPPKVSFLNSLDDEFINNVTSLIQNPKIENTSKEIIDKLNSSINSSFSSTAINNATLDESFGKFEFFAKLDYPSVYGIEEVDVYVKDDKTIRNPNQDFILKTKTLKWNVGEQYKKVEVELLDDLYVEDDERVTFGFNNFKYSDEAEKNNQFFLTIQDKDKPIPIRFAQNSQEIIESASTLSISLFLDRPMNVPNQTVVVYADLAESTAELGENFLGTDSSVVTTSTEKVNYVIDVDVEEKGGNSSFSFGQKKGGQIRRKTGSFLADGFKPNKEITYNSINRFGNKVDIDKKIIITQVTNKKLILKESTLTYQGPPSHTDLEATFTYEFEKETFGAFEKTINLKEGVSDFKFDIDILNDFKYDVDLNIKLKLKDPSQNVIISDGTDKEHVITIKNSMIPKFTRYVFPGDFEKGYGMFRMNNFLVTDKKPLKLAVTDDVDIPNNFTDKFSYFIEIINKGEQIVTPNKLTPEFETSTGELGIEGANEFLNNPNLPIKIPFKKGNRVVSTDETVGIYEVPKALSGFRKIIIDLPSNYGLKKEINQFLKSKYEFRLRAKIIPFPPPSSTLNFGNNTNFGNETKARNFPEIKIPAETNGFLADLDPKKYKYFLTTEIENIKNRIKFQVIPNQGKTFTCTDSIVQGTTSSVGYAKKIEINGTIFLNEIFEESNSGFFNFGNSNNEYTKVLRRSFTPYEIDYITCSGSSENNNLIPSEVSSFSGGT